MYVSPAAEFVIKRCRRVATRVTTAAPTLHATLILAAVEAVTATGLVKRFEATTAVDELDLVVAAGQVHGLLGANGAGKTTLLRLLFGLIAPDAGSIRLLGRSLGGPGSAALDHVAGFVEEPSFYPYLSGTANLALLAKLDGGVPAAALIDEVLERVGLDRREPAAGWVATPPGCASGSASPPRCCAAPRLLLLDEPTSGLDPAGARAVAALVRELADQGVAVLLSSHQIGELEKVCDAYTVIREGRVVWDGTAAQLAAQAPASAYLLVTSDDDRALEVAAGIAGVRAGRSPRGQLAIAVQEGGSTGWSWRSATRASRCGGWSCW